MGHTQSRSLWVPVVTLLDALLLTRNGPKVPPEGGPHVVHGDRSFDCHDADFAVVRRDRGGDPPAVWGRCAARDSSA